MKYTEEPKKLNRLKMNYIGQADVEGFVVSTQFTQASRKDSRLPRGYPKN